MTAVELGLGRVAMTETEAPSILMETEALSILAWCYYEVDTAVRGSAKQQCAQTLNENCTGRAQIMGQLKGSNIRDF